MDDNERTRELKNEAARHIALAHQAVEAVSGVEVQIAANALESRTLAEGVASLACLIDRYRGEAVQEPDEEPVGCE